MLSVKLIRLVKVVPALEVNPKGVHVCPLNDLGSGPEALLIYIFFL